MVTKRDALAALRAQISTLENRPAFAEGAAALRLKPAEGLLQTAPGLLHEIFTDEGRNGGALLGFALGLAQNFLSPARPALFYLQLGHEAAEVGLPYGPGLLHFGLDPQNLILVRTRSPTELLWAAEEAIGCRSVAAILADIGGHPKPLDFTATRRLSLRAAAAGTSAFLLRYGRDREASASALRWRLNPQRSGAAPFDPRAPGETRWEVELEKGVLNGAPVHPGAAEGWILGWADNGFRIVETRGTGELPARTALPGARSAALGDRLAQTA